MRVREDRRMPEMSKLVGYQIARDQSRDETAKVLYCMEAVAGLLVWSHI